MCGLFYHSSPTWDGSVDYHDLLRLRGPDNQSVMRNGQGTFYHTRLSLFDLSPRSNQPRFSSGTSFVFNGEIFNFRDFGGYTSDTLMLDVELSQCFEEGRSLSTLLNTFNGFFAIVAVDDTNRVRLIRDRYGEKPLFFALHGGDMVASSCAAVVAETVDAVVDRSQLMAQCKNPFIRQKTDGVLKTIYSGVYEVPPGCLVSWVPAKPNGIKVLEWYDLQGDIVKYSHDDFDALLSSSVELRGVSDAPGAVTLSGGVDSTVLAAVLAKKGIDLPTYTLASADAEIAEDSIARVNADTLGLRHELIVESTEVKKLTFVEIKRVIYGLGRPYFDPNIAQSLLYKRLRSDGIKFTLDGHGADELMGGYQWMMPDVFLQKILDGRPVQAFRVIHAYLRSFPKSYGSKKLRWLLSGVWHSLRTRFVRETIFGSRPSFRHATQYREVFSRVMRGLLHNYDSLSMAYSVEVRSPFLDHRVVANILGNKDGEFLFRHKTKQKLRDALDAEGLRVASNKIGFRSSLWATLSEHERDLLFKYYEQVIETFPESLQLMPFNKKIESVAGLHTLPPSIDQGLWRVVSYGVFLEENRYDDAFSAE